MTDIGTVTVTVTGIDIDIDTESVPIQYQPKFLVSQTLSHANQPLGAARVSVPNLRPRQSCFQNVYTASAWPKVWQPANPIGL